MHFYMTERNHDRMMEKSPAAVGVPREALLRAQPLPATMAIMASLGVYAYDFPLALISTRRSSPGTARAGNCATSVTTATRHRQARLSRAPR